LPGYEAYGRIFDRIADENHRSCAILTGREKPHGITLREGLNLPVRSIQLVGLSIAAAQNLLADKGISAPKHQQQTLINYFNGNPLALKISATTIQNLFAGNIQAFLNQGMVVFGNLWDLLDRQFDRLSCLEQQVMYLLAIHRVEIPPDLLQAKFLPSVTSRQLWAALELLRDRSAIETTARGLTQQPLMMEYVTARFLERIEEELLAGKLDLLRSYPLIAEPDRNRRRDAQIQAILQPLIDRLSCHFATHRQLELHLEQLMATLPDRICYAAINLTDLCSHPNANSIAIEQHADRLALL
jgi:muconolactone delta-isomerase